MRNIIQFPLKPLLKGEPYFLGHTFKYVILIQLKNSQDVKFSLTRYVWKRIRGSTNKVNPTQTRKLKRSKSYVASVKLLNPSLSWEITLADTANPVKS